MAFHLNVYLVLINCVFVMNAQQTASDIKNYTCNYEDTVDLSNTEQLPNGSYYYEHTVLIPPDRTAVYDYEELHGGRRVTVASHIRGCLCNEYRCVKFCCHPTKELILNNSRACSAHELDDELFYDPYINITLNNGSHVMSHIRNDFFVIQGVPCEYSYPMVPEEDEDDRWILFENGTLYRYFDQAFISKRDYCMQPFQVKSGDWVLNPMNCPLENHPTLSNRINNIAMAISVPFILLTALIYILLPELRNLHGKCLISYLISLAIGYGVLCSITLSLNVFPVLTCSLLGYSAYFFLMAAFFWLNTISYDLWQNFRFTAPQRLTQRKRYLIYCLYAWGCPMLLTITVIVAQNSDLDYGLKPGIGDDYCWLKTDDWSAMIYFFGVNLLIIIVNIFMFICTFTKILQIQHELQRALSKPEKSQHLRNHRNNVTLFLRLFIIMGVSWLLDILSYVVGHDANRSNNILFLISDFMNAIQGVLIFILFVLKPKVWKLLKLRLSSLGGHEPSAISQRITLQSSVSKTKFNMLIPHVQ